MDIREQVSRFCDRLLSNEEGFIEVNLSYLDPSMNDAEMTAVTAALSVNTHVQKIWLGGRLRNVSDGVFRSFVEKVLSLHPSLQYVSLGSNNLTDTQAEWIGSALKTNRSLKKLDLYDNSIGDQGALALADGLRHNKTITTLWLSGNNIGDEGCEGFATFLRRNSTLCVLYLINNSRITAAGATALEATLQHMNYALVELYLNDIMYLDDIISGATQMQQMQQYRIDRLCQNNRRLRAAFAQWKIELQSISLGLMPRALELFEIKPDLLYSMLKAKPELFQERPNRRRRRRPERLRY